MNIFRFGNGSKTDSLKITKGEDAMDDMALMADASTDATQAETGHQRTSKTLVREDTQQTLLERLGGEPALDEAVDLFYDRLVDDPVLENFFEGRDMSRLRRHQAKFMKIAFTGIPEGMDVEKLIFRAHRRLFEKEGLNASHFDLVAGHLVDTLQSLGIAADLIDEVVAIVGPLRAVFDIYSIDC